MSDMVYGWKPGAHPPRVDPQIVGERLQYLRDTFGHLTARVVVEDARSADSPLHDALDWDTDKAIENWLLTQAGQLIRFIVAVPAEQPERKPIRAFVVLNDVGEGDFIGSYVALSDDTLRQQVLGRALRELRQFQEKYRELNELAKVFMAIEQLSDVA